ncbi:hypothetical protein LN050_01930 [Comamonadaceae bacterium M7527]|nr:hypothetical protein LN050_01930 [Comamonadaceae bacterium M7527]
MTEDLRCCGSGTCIINAEGLCWCGQQWDGDTMCRPPLAPAQQTGVDAKPPTPSDHTDKDTGTR